jgi:hypothetical protein
MTPDDEKELHRLSEMLRRIDGHLEDKTSREGLQKAGIALMLAFLRGLRPELEKWYAGIDAPISEVESVYLRSLGLEPEDPEEP